MTRILRVVLSLIGAGILLVTMGGPASAWTAPARTASSPRPALTSTDARATPAAEVKIGQEGRVGRFASIDVPVIYRCQRPWIVAGLSVVVTQGAVSGTASRSAGLRCDARWHHLDVSAGSGSGDPFVRGTADVHAFFDVADPVTFDPVDQAQADASLWVSPAARVAAVSGRVNEDGTASIVVKARCQRPWVAQELTVEVTQRDGSVGGLTPSPTPVVCDARWQRPVVRVTGNEAFTAGPATVRVTLTVLDPVDFDPVDQDMSVTSVTLAR